MQHKFSIEAIEFQIASEVRCDEEGRGFYTIRGTARLAGIDDSGLSKSLATGADSKPSKLSAFLIQQGFEGAELTRWNKSGIPDQAVLHIVEYFAFEAGRFCTQQSLTVFRFLGKIGVRALSHKLTGWQPQSKNTDQHGDIEQYKAALLKAVLEEQIPENATTWQCRYTKDFWEALEDLYGLKQGHRGCAAFINNYIYGYFPPEVQSRLNQINPLLENGTRANRQHQHFDDVLLEVLRNHIGKVIFLLKASADKKAFRKSMQKIKKIKFNLGNIKYLKGAV